MKPVTRRGRKAVPFVIARCRDAGVHAGYLRSHKGSEVTLSQARRLWLWRVPMGKGAFLSGVALHGLGEDCRIGDAIDVILTECCEIISVTKAAQASIEGYATHARTR